jgi:hypothetical protein
MDAEQLEKELDRWNRFMYMALASSITLAVISFGNFLESGWSGFERYMSGLWQWIQLAVTPPVFYLLWSKRWKALPFQDRRNTILGFFLASWFTFLSLGFITVNGLLVSFLILVGAISLFFRYVVVVKRKSNQADEIFP